MKKKLSMMMLTVAAALLSSCGPATFDIDNPEESTNKMLESLSNKDKIAFVQAVQQITLHQLREQGLSLMEMAKISKDTEKSKEILRCLDGKTVVEIIDMAKNID